MLVQAADQPADPHQRGGDLSQAALPPAVAQAGARAARARAHRGGQTRRHQQRRRRVAGRAGQAAAAAERPGALHLQPARQPRAAAPLRRCGAVPRGRRLQPPLDAARRAAHPTRAALLGLRDRGQAAPPLRLRAAPAHARRRAGGWVERVPRAARELQAAQEPGEAAPPPLPRPDTHALAPSPRPAPPRATPSPQPARQTSSPRTPSRRRRSVSAPPPPPPTSLPSSRAARAA